MTTAEPDELYTLRNLFWIGAFQEAINEASASNRLSSNLIAEKEEFVYRCYLGLGQYHVILSEIKDTLSTTSVNLRAIKLLAQYLSNPATKDVALSQIQEWLSDPVASSNTTIQLISAIIYVYDDNLKEAITSIHQPSNMEQHALLVQLYLRMDRLDLATKQVKTMKSIDDDHVLTTLANAWVNLATGGTKIQEAAYAFDELIDKYGGSSLLLNGFAVAKMHTGNYEEAETHLQEALTKAPSDPDSLANLITVSQYLSREPAVIGRYLAQLKAKAPGHQLVKSLETFESAYDRVCNSISGK